MFKDKHGLLPATITIANHFEFENRLDNRYRFRRGVNDTTPRLLYRTASGEKSVQHRGEKLWNDLPPYIKDLDSLKSFKRFYKAHLIE